MDKDVECGKYLRLEIFDKYWNILKSNYRDTQHTDFEYKYYYSIFREYKEEDFIKAIKMVLKYKQYFPRVDEIVEYLPMIDEISEEQLPEWFNKNFEKDEISEEESKEMDELLKSLV